MFATLEREHLRWLAWLLAGFVLLAVTLHSQPAIAAEAAPVDPKTMEFSAGTALGNMFKEIKGIFNPDISDSIGKRIVMAFLVMGIVIGGVQIMGGMDAVEAIVRYVKFGALGLLAIACFSPVGWLGGETLGTLLRGLFIDTGLAVLTESKDPPVYMALRFMEVFDAAVSVPVIPPHISGWSDRVGFVLANPIETLVAMIMVVLASVTLLLAGMIVIGEIFMASITMDLAIALAPILTPWIMWRPTSFLFDAWLKTILISGMAFMIASLMGKGALAFVGEAAKIAPAAGVKPGESYTMFSIIASYGGFFLLSLVFLFLATRVSSLAGALIRGGILSGVSIQEFRQGVGSLGGLASRAASGAAPAAGAAAGAAGGVYGAFKGRKGPPWAPGALAGGIAGMKAGASKGYGLTSAAVRAVGLGRK
jgi:hypothetical protein